ncbi:SAM-dependent chlorinase/fluorinase [Rivularia sp. UHCC 0363]|uniref:SAM hydrolase/SAM-dependent halogenase family protein n=1 Tax=Rivularia sp. UHCC 0363 TaxID=3110244 RepID=UPI002B21673F|nr:SAM-dependent chlorinase/fluorinase [Rivularia sp. UHCC 0363]MEA5595179.1 SAM-dependent chlorinase/fluorinase [Rivularia sp. UHCC 0363]
MYDSGKSTKQRLLTLLSDFGISDEYVAVMKGAIAQINPMLRVIDITHQIPPQNIIAARFCLMNAFPYFPVGTVHVAVVDPGVGGKRRAVAVELAQGFLVAPDNGLISGVLSQNSAIAAVELTNPDYWLTQPSNTFHGRDIFAPVAAHLANGISLQKLGQEINPESLVKLDLPECSRKDDILIGCIQYIDHFGNLVTNIPQNFVKGKNWSAEIQGNTIKAQKTYSDVKIGEIIALIGSHGWVEIAVNGGNAELELGVKFGDEVRIS